MTHRVLIAGFGNPLAGDDGAGIAVVDRLGEAGLPAHHRVVRGGTDSSTLADLWDGEPQVWLVDAVIRNAAPGTIHFVDHDELLALPQRHATAHELSLPECLRWVLVARPEMNRVRFRLWGIEPRVVRHAEGLTAVVDRAVDRLVAELWSRLSVLRLQATGS